MRPHKSSVVCSALCTLAVGLFAAPRAHAYPAGSDVIANPVPPPAGAIQVGLRGEQVRNIQVHSGNQNDAVWLANQFNGSLWAYLYSGELQIVAPNGTFGMADFPPAEALPWVGTMDPYSQFPGASIALVQIQVVPEALTHPSGLWVEVEIQGGDIDVVFDQLLYTIYSYNPGT
jgi:hypothetical protein